jgi:hypothetical protein
MATTSNIKKQTQEKSISSKKKSTRPTNAGAGKGNSLLQEYFIESLQDI